MSGKKLTASELNQRIARLIAGDRDTSEVGSEVLTTMTCSQIATSNFTYRKVKLNQSEQEFIVTDVCKDTHISVLEDFNRSRSMNLIPSVQEVALKIKENFGATHPPVLIPIAQCSTILGVRRNHFVLGVLSSDRSGSRLTIIDSRPSWGGLFYSSPLLKKWDPERKKFVKDPHPAFSHSYWSDYLCHGAQTDSHNCGRFVFGAIKNILNGEFNLDQKSSFMERLKRAPQRLMFAMRRAFSSTASVVAEYDQPSSSLPVPQSAGAAASVVDDQDGFDMLDDVHHPAAATGSPIHMTPEIARGIGEERTARSSPAGLKFDRTALACAPILANTAAHQGGAQNSNGNAA